MSDMSDPRVCGKLANLRTTPQRARHILCSSVEMTARGAAGPSLASAAVGRHRYLVTAGSIRKIVVPEKSSTQTSSPTTSAT